MCVTNTTHRRIQAVSLNPNQLQVSPSVLSQRLLGSFPLSAQLPLSSSASGTSPFVPAFPSSKACEYQQQQYPVLSGSAPLHENAKSRPKRRRKPQKPGKTAKMNDRHFVVHNYHDHSHDPDIDVDEDHSSYDEHHSHGFDHSDEGRRRGGVAVAFPLKLHAVLEQVERDGYSHVVSWSPHGRCFVIHKPKQFTEEVMPKYFRQSKLTSFQRQLNLYGFSRLTRGPDAGGYYHELFLRNREYLCKRMTRTKVKGTKFKAASSPESEPDFYTMPPVASHVTPHHSSDEEEELSYDSSRYTMPMAATSGMLSYPSVSYQPQQQQVAPPLSSLSFAPSGLNASNVVSVSSTSSASSSSLSSSDFALDSAVDELLLNELGDQDDLLSDLASWDAGAFGGETGVEMEDVQLGFMLEKLLEDL